MVKRRMVIGCLGVLSACSPPQPSPGDQAADNTVANGWQYRTYDDPMRKSRSWIAELTATNPAQLEFPYQGGTNAKIELVQNQGDAPDNQQATLILSNGQYDCHDCSFSIKFDDGELLSTSGTRDDCGEDQCVNLNVYEDTENFGTKKYIGFNNRLRASKMLVVEVPIYKFGSQQFKFKTAGLVWPQPGAPKEGAGSGLADGSRAPKVD